MILGVGKASAYIYQIFSLTGGNIIVLARFYTDQLQLPKFKL